MGHSRCIFKYFLLNSIPATANCVHPAEEKQRRGITPHTAESIIIFYFIYNVPLLLVFMLKIALISGSYVAVANPRRFVPFI
jgi:hypothetical protein